MDIAAIKDKSLGGGGASDKKDKKEKSDKEAKSKPAGKAASKARPCVRAVRASASNLFHLGLGTVSPGEDRQGEGEGCQGDQQGTRRVSEHPALRGHNPRGRRGDCSGGTQGGGQAGASSGGGQGGAQRGEGAQGGKERRWR